VVQRLREWYLDADQKSGKKRRDLEVSTCFAPLLKWIVRFWKSEKRQLPLVMDATTLSTRWTILSISVVLSGCAIPVAWMVFPAQQEGSWQPHWEKLFHSLASALPPDWEVLVLADRGLYARWLYDLIRSCGWHPFLRLNQNFKACREGSEEFEWVSQWVPTPGTHWKGRAECFVGKKTRLEATLLMHWEPGYKDPWIILTDLEPEQAQTSWYGLRTWIEGGFKDFKRGLWGWHHNKMQRASEIERLWLAMALAQLWCVSLGCQAEAEQEAKEQENEPGSGLPETHIARRRRKRLAGQRPARRLSCVVRGRIILHALQYQGQPFPVGILRSQLWPETMTPPQKQPKKPAVRDPRKNLREKARRQRQKDRSQAKASTKT
jgi:hypothetical protein